MPYRHSTGAPQGPFNDLSTHGVSFFLSPGDVPVNVARRSWPVGGRHAPNIYWAVVRVGRSQTVGLAPILVVYCLTDVQSFEPFRQRLSLSDPDFCKLLLILFTDRLDLSYNSLTHQSNKTARISTHMTYWSVQFKLSYKT